MEIRSIFAILLAPAALLPALPLAAQTIAWSGLIEARAVAAGGERSWTRSGLGKSQYDGDNGGLRMGQGILAAEAALSNTVAASVVLNAADDRQHVIDLQEAWLGWNPLPMGAWKLRAKAGIFFPTMNLETDYDRATWTSTRTISASAINSWIGEEIRSKGVEFSATRLGRHTGSPHDVGFTLSVFNGNDPAGTLIAWRGWSIGDRMTGLSESLQLADLPVYRPSGQIRKQTRDIHLFRELDGRLGYYVGANYAYAGRIEVNAMHYDNRGDPLVVEGGQYSWTTRFNHLGLRLRPAGEWEFLLQALSGSTGMGRRAVYATYRAWYVLAAHPLGAGRLALRYDRFRMGEEENLFADPNSERGTAVALAYTHPLTPSMSLVTELLTIRSSRLARALSGDAVQQTTSSLTTALRWQF